MKKLKLLLLLAGVLMALPVVARDFSFEHEGHTITYTIIDQDARICMTKAGSSAAPGNEVEGSLTLPANPVDGTTTYTLTAIGDYSFAKCGSLSSISIPSTVTSIGVEAFRSCTGLTSVVIPPSVTTLDEDAFWLCTGLEKSAYPEHLYNPFESGVVIKYPTESTITADGVIYDADITKLYYAPYSIHGSFIVPSTVTTIGQSALLDCNSVSKIVIPGSVTTIEPQAFKGCGYLSELFFEDNDSPINMTTRDVFEGCHASKLYLGRNLNLLISGYGKTPVIPSVSTLIIGNSVTSIPSYSFNNCSDLTSVVIPNSVTSIGEYAFSGCSGLTSVVIPNSVETIGDRAFSQCSGLNSVVIGNSVQTIGMEAFAGCAGLTGELIITNSVETIGKYAFYLCNSLTSVAIGNSVKTIGYWAFNGCNSLKKVDFGSVESLCNMKFEDYFSNPLRHCPDNLYINGEKATDLVIPEGVTAIGDNLFYDCRGLKSVVIGNSVETIGEGTFGGCTGLISVLIGNSVQTIGENAFNGCYPYKSAYPNTIENPIGSTSICYPAEGAIIENGFVYGPDKSVIYFASSSLKGEFKIPDSVTSIGDQAFSGCTDLTSVEFGNSFKTIGEEAFSGCSGLTGELIIPNSVTFIGDHAFSGCSSLNSVVIGNSVETIGEGTFGGCAGLTSIIIPNSVTSIDGWAFQGCTGLTSIIIGNSVKTIGDHAFYGCSSLNSVVIGNSVETIGDEAFKSCRSLKYVFSLNPEAPSIDGNALRDIPNDAILYVPKGSVEKYAYATGWYRIYDIRELDSLLGLTISEQNVRVEVGEAAELTVTAVSDVPSDLEPFIVAGTEQWMSDNEAVATVENGVVKAIGAGTTTITYSVEDRFGYTHSVECEVKVPYMRGDANGNNSLAVNDVILTARGVVNDLDPALVMEAADMNGDDALTVGDLTLVVNAVISYEVPAKGAERNYQRAMEADGMASPLLLTQNGSEINVAFDGDGRFTGVQFDVVGDDGLSVTSVTLAGAAIQSHSAANHRLETGAMRMLAYGTETFAANGTFAAIHTESADMQPCTLTITNVMAGDFNGNLYRLPDCGIDVLSQAGVAAVTNGSLNIAVEGRTLVITSGEDTTVVISDMKGITTTLEIEAGVTRHTLTTAGAYIVNNNKIMIR